MSNKQLRIMFVDDDVITGKVMKRNCDNAGYACQVFTDAENCLNKFLQVGADLVITDLRMPGMTGFDLLSELRQIDTDIPVLVMTGYSSVENAVEAMKRGASDFIKKPFDFNELQLMIERSMKAAEISNENKLLKRRLGSRRNRFGLIGDTRVMKTLFDTIDKLAEVDCCAVILGESGTGKELVARALHEHSPRKNEYFVSVDCSRINETVFQREMFGHVQHGVNDATLNMKGLVEQANGGTLFLDDIGKLSDDTQVKLLRVLDEKYIQRVGSTTQIPIDIRIISASNDDVDLLLEQGKTRADFYSRLSVVSVMVPSLDERRDDIPALVEAFVLEFAERYNRKVQGYDSVSLHRLCQAHWNGNVRALRNAVERSIILADGPVLKWQSDDDEMSVDNSILQFSSDEFVSLVELEYEYISHVLNCFKGKKTKVANVLGIDKTTLWRKLRRYDNSDEHI
ncbi:Response regulator of zinc sigma-54-dependent two-component system [hydrothermal vent metagenome]|uniref:Response regulator of zinc sigma-54-dependent two-component system n=1 Tax=hydrothermal vent metagenome TaxID=652676 RepID=A0A3B1A7R8_9ZZZZ